MTMLVSWPTRWDHLIIRQKLIRYDLKIRLVYVTFDFIVPWFFYGSIIPCLFAKEPESKSTINRILERLYLDQEKLQRHMISLSWTLYRGDPFAKIT